MHQYVLTSAEGEFIESFEYIKEKASNSETHARKVAKKLYEICEQWDILDNLFIIGADTTPTNTGWKGGIFYFFEQRLGRRLFRVECQLHINELPLRAIIENVIGERSCKTKLNGEIGDRLLLATIGVSEAKSQEGRKFFYRLTMGYLINILPADFNSITG